MKVLGYVLAGCIMLAVVKAAIIGLALTLLLVIAIAFVRAPAEALAVVGGLTTLSIFNTYPAATIGAVALLAIASLALKRRTAE